MLRRRRPPSQAAPLPHHRLLPTFLATGPRPMRDPSTEEEQIVHRHWFAILRYSVTKEPAALTTFVGVAVRGHPLCTDPTTITTWAATAGEVP
jgi:hypothetical protein